MMALDRNVTTTFKSFAFGLFFNQETNVWIPKDHDVLGELTGGRDEVQIEQFDDLTVFVRVPCGQSAQSSGRLDHTDSFFLKAVDEFRLHYPDRILLIPALLG